jgi:tripartite-type tricarboxylate transporter receptor subunit TctC
MTKLGGVFAALSAAGLCSAAQAQDFPSKPVTIVVAFAAGGPFENIRPLAQFMEKSWGRPVLIENRPGAGGIVGSEHVIKSPPDGHTLLYGFAGLTAFKALVKDLRIDAIKDFSQISTYIELAGGFTTNPQVPAKTVEEFVAHAKANPGKLNYGSIGRNTTVLLTEAFIRAAGLQIAEIQYSGTALVTTAILRNDIQLGQLTFNAALRQQADSNLLRPFLVIAERRAKLFPEIPTAIEKGYNIPRNGWTAVLGPANMPRPVVDKINGEMVKFAKSPEAQKYAEQQGVDLTSSTPEQLRALMESQQKLWVDIAQAIGLQPQ